MVGAAFIGFFAGSGMWLTLLTLLALRALFLGSIEVLARIHFNYRQRHPYNPARARRNGNIFYIAIATLSALDVLYVYLTR